MKESNNKSPNVLKLNKLSIAKLYKMQMTKGGANRSIMVKSSCDETAIA